MMYASHVLAGIAVNVTAIGLNSLWEDAIVIACVWMLVRAYPRINAATRYLIWGAALAAAVIVPIATTVPFLSTSPPAAATPAVKAPVQSVTRAFTASARDARPYDAAKTQPAISDGRRVNRPAFRRLHFALPVWLAVVAASAWALIAFAGLLQLGAGLFRLERLKRDALPLPIEYRDEMSRWNAALKGHRDVRLCVSDQIDVPVAVGLFDSMILIPRELLARLSPEEIDQIALHELAHLRRADDWTNGVQRVVLAVLGWNPSVRFATAQLDLEREVACDDHVLSSSTVVRPYAMCLAKMAESSSWPRRSMAAPAVFATRKHLSLRIERLLFAGRATGTRASFGAAALALAAVCAIGVAIGTIAPSVAATTALPNVPATAAVLVQHPAQAVRQIVRYVNVPRTTQVAVVTASPQPSVATHAVVPMHAVTTTQPHATTRPAAAMHLPVTTHSVADTGVATVGANGTISIRIPAINVAVPKIALAIGGTPGARSCMGCDESGADLRGKNLRGANYVGVNLSRANLDGADLSGGSFQGVDFSHASLRGASLRNARLSGCDFSDADLSNADFTGATVASCDFTHAKLLATLVRSIVSTCSGCDFSGSTLGAVDLSNLHATRIDFSGADLAHANLSGSSFTAVDFSGARLAGANVAGATFTDCDLSGSGLRRSDLSRARLIDTDYPDDR
ncbi:MAG TPA: pentapeptide repeat-containing protein [Candidatus Tumulicola sp.]|jgi:uncharacterized protein YjbI with pentapeptide repeats/beta-lactamase regulating signal transducer with metallopeptidase domain